MPLRFVIKCKSKYNPSCDLFFTVCEPKINNRWNEIKLTFSSACSPTVPRTQHQQHRLCVSSRCSFTQKPFTLFFSLISLNPQLYLLNSCLIVLHVSPFSQLSCEKQFLEKSCRLPQVLTSDHCLNKQRSMKGISHGIK